MKHVPNITLKNGLAIALLLLAWLGIMFISGLTLPGILKNLIVMSKDSPADDSPWYFARRDFIDGICAWISFGLMIPVLFCLWKLSKTIAFILLWQTPLWLGLKGFPAIGIAVRTRHLFDISAAGPWTTLEEYWADPVQITLKFISVIFVVIVIAFQRNYMKNAVDRQRQNYGTKA